MRNSLDDPISETVKRRLLKLLFSRKYRPPRPPPTWKDREKAILEEFDPLPPQKAVRTIQDYKQKILEVFEEEQKKRHEQVFCRTPWAIGNYLRVWQMDVPAEHPLRADPENFFKVCASRYTKSSQKRSPLSVASSFSLLSGSSYKKGVQMKLKSSPNLCTTTNRRPVSRPAKSKGS